MMYTGESVVHVQQSEESRHQSDTGCANRARHKFVVFLADTRYGSQQHLYCCIRSDHACSYPPHQRGSRDPGTSIRHPRCR